MWKVGGIKVERTLKCASRLLSLLTRLTLFTLLTLLTLLSLPKHCIYSGIYVCLHIAICLERYDGKSGKDQPGDELKHSIYDIKHSLHDSHLSTRWLETLLQQCCNSIHRDNWEIITYALGEHDPWTRPLSAPFLFHTTIKPAPLGQFKIAEHQAKCRTLVDWIPPRLLRLLKHLRFK